MTAQYALSLSILASFAGHDASHQTGNHDAESHDKRLHLFLV